MKLQKNLFPLPFTGVKCYSLTGALSILADLDIGLYRHTSLIFPTFIHPHNKLNIFHIQELSMYVYISPKATKIIFTSLNKCVLMIYKGTHRMCAVVYNVNSLGFITHNNKDH